MNFHVPAGIAAIILIACFAYYPALSGGFIWDDTSLLTNNHLIKAADGLYRFWCTAESYDYWPMTYTTFWIEWRLWGMNSTGYHVANLILHIVEALLLWVILRKLSIPGAFLAAMVFVVHPVNVESVAWIAQRKGLLAMLFFLLSILCYLRYFSVSCSDNGQRSRHTPCAGPAHGVCGLFIGRWYWVSLAAFVLAMLSKGSVAILPVLLLGIVWWLRPLTKWDVVRTVPFFVVAAVLAAVNVWFQTHGSGHVIRGASFCERLLGAGGVVWFYLYKALLPLNLAFVYPQWHIQAGNPLWWLPLIVAVFVTAVLWRYREGWSRALLFAWGFFCVALAPVMGFTDVYFMKYTLVADHYQHIALVGVIALAAAGWSVWHKQAQGPMRRAVYVVAVVVVSTLTLLTYQQSGLYRGEITLYQATLENSPDCWMVHNNLGVILLHADRPQEASEHFQQVLRLKSDDPDAHVNLGICLTKVGRLPEASGHFEQALLLKPDLAEAHNNLGIVLAKTGRLPEARGHFEQALRIKPNDAEAHNNLGLALANTGRIQEAMEQFRRALQLKADYPDAHFNLGNALTKADRQPEAIAHFEQALLLKPDYAEAYFNLALAYANTRQSSEAIAAARKALVIAQAKGQTALSKQIENWLNSYRAGRSSAPNAGPATEPALPP